MDTRGLRRFTDVELVGEQVRLRPLRREDASAAFELLSDDLVTRTLLWDGPSSVEALADAYEAMGLPDDGGGGPSYSFAVEAFTRPRIVGSIAARPRLHPWQLDLGYWLGAPYWGGGLMTDAVRLVTHFAFRHLDAVRVYATVFVGNEGSRRVLEKCGFALDGSLRRHVLKRQEWLDEWFFSLLRPEWQAGMDWYLPRQERLA